MKRIIMILIATLAALPDTADAQDLTACFSVELLDHQEDEEVVLQQYGFRNNCAEWTHVDWYQRSVDPVTQAPDLYPDGYLNVLPGESAYTRVSWRKEHGPFPAPVLAWCGWRDDDEGWGRCAEENDFVRGSKANWRVRERP